MPQRSGEHSASKRAGEFQRSKPGGAFVTFVQLDRPTPVWLDRFGNVWLDEQCSRHACDPVSGRWLIAGTSQGRGGPDDE
jgi:hypothetical protein